MTDALWLTLADWTGRFNWAALSAIGTVGALWFALIQSNRAQRTEHLRAVGTLTALVGLIEPITEAFPIFEPREGDSLTKDEAALVMDARSLIHRAVEGLQAFHVSDLATVEATEYATALPLALSALEGAATPTTLSGSLKASRLNNQSAYIAEACDYFRLQRQYLRHGSLIRRLSAIPLPERISPSVFRAARRLYPKRW
jgi:hypothetical protein